MWTSAGTAICLLGVVMTLRQAFGSTRTWADRVEATGFVVIVAALMLGSLAFLISRLAFHWRRQREPSRIDPLSVYDERPAVVVLVPAYREEASVVRQTLVSAMLQQDVETNVVLLIDDPPTSLDPVDIRLLDDARALPSRVMDWIDEPHRRTQQALDDHVERTLAGEIDLGVERRELVDVLSWTSRWLSHAADAEPVTDHTDHLFVSRILRSPADELRTLCTAMIGRAHDELSLYEVRSGFERLARRFNTSVSSFERKQYDNLSHAPNKAMNLNSYLGLLGGRWNREERDTGLHIVPAHGECDVDLAAPDFVITLDADSIIESNYAFTLIGLASHEAGADLAVVQTPYSAIPPATNSLERIAGATTDIQYIIHQGFAGFGAGFWVGANALIRTEALADLRTITTERGHEIEKFVSDRTVIEDTESSLDLAAMGWRIDNHPERLSYSATPPDFGSLIIQRRRWANGGLILLPKLRQAWRRQPFNVIGLFLRTHYLASIAITNTALLILLLTGFGADYVSWWLPISAAPYLALYARDLAQAGYRRTDVVRVYALNVLLVPANLAGVAKSIDQIIRGTPTPFARTPKVSGRTPASPFYHLANICLIGLIGLAIVLSLLAGQTLQAVFAGLNVVLLVYATTAYVGWGAMLDDLRIGLRRQQQPSAPLRQTRHG